MKMTAQNERIKKTHALNAQFFWCYSIHIMYTYTYTVRSLTDSINTLAECEHIVLV